ncbi:peroxin-26 Pex26-Penicillium chrysogenum [Penicillium samsonianum]|uniref:peroxin-26 Pex26-Penicillium chrysogenum n=1 Tax=Penicillium samsonianum TaxID=1882272 RepID=UPI002548FCBC|nr:peroxin-26 Pex26-Penicillium chrysogenum [Penicillium samsonianum]XP_057133868.1 peroxin-26 Pex26-Penicillium chrysogenum [Penicillium samsonianum]KAJ6118457.1 peroxin-26 Pex26-Penicillium chrysogenum [Penicillium samsonianum]KAJ6129049.1 peroxin-26 Pex26-Penicillium chrysogenum [Penicillium samsonianum]
MANGPPMSSHSHAPSSASPTKLCSKTYKKASQLYLTRRLPEALANLQPIITPSAPEDQHTNGDSSTPVAPIATAAGTWRIKVWNLYITLLSAIVDLGAEEGKKQFGLKEWKSIASQVREGAIWETVVEVGYQGHEGSVDAEVVYNLATLLLTHSSSQSLNQQRLETYLSSYGQPNLDLTDRLQDASDVYEQRPLRTTSGADTPKDLTARVKIIELFTLHVLPRNDEWEYSTEFVNLSEVLDEERKDLFLQTLEGLKEEKERGEMRAVELQRAKDAELEQQREDERREAEEAAAAAARLQSNGHKRSTSEVDYGIEKNRSQASPKGKGARPSTDKSPNGKSRTSLSSSGSKNVKKQDKVEPRGRSSQAVATGLRNIFRHIIRTVSGNPMSIVRTLLFVIGILMAMSRQGVRDRIRRVTDGAWQKVKATAGMGVKVSYI